MNARKVDQGKDGGGRKDRGVNELCSFTSHCQGLDVIRSIVVAIVVVVASFTWVKFSWY